MEKRTHKQNKAMHKGFQQIADLLIENGVPLSVVVKNLDVRPTPEVIKSLYREIARAKYGVKSTTELDRKQVDQVWEDLVKGLSEVTGVYIPFPSEENTQAYLESYEI